MATHRQIIAETEWNVGRGEGMCLTSLLREKSLRRRPRNQDESWKQAMQQSGKPFSSEVPHSSNSASSHLISPSHLQGPANPSRPEEEKNDVSLARRFPTGVLQEFLFFF